MKMVNLGCGRVHHPDWINVDFNTSDPGVVRHDLLTGLPFADGEVDVVYHAHVLEHFGPREGAAFLRECFRVLRPGGLLRVGVPDLEEIAREYLRRLEAAERGEEADAAHRYDWIKLELIDQMVRRRSGGGCGDYLLRDAVPVADYVDERWGGAAREINAAYRASKENPPPRRTLRDRIAWRLRHPFARRENEATRIGRFMLSGESHLWMYERYSLARILEECGFTELAVVDPFQSSIPRWKDFALEAEGDMVRKPHTLVIEARKPRAG
jgi:SAM-dependent methyltransferase